MPDCMMSRPMLSSASTSPSCSLSDSARSFILASSSRLEPVKEARRCMIECECPPTCVASSADPSEAARRPNFAGAHLHVYGKPVWFRASAHERRCAGSVIVKARINAIASGDTASKLFCGNPWHFRRSYRTRRTRLGPGRGSASSSDTMHPTAQQSRGGP